MKQRMGKLLQVILVTNKPPILSSLIMAHIFFIFSPYVNTKIKL